MHEGAANLSRGARGRNRGPCGSRRFADERYAIAWQYVAHAVRRGPRMVLGRPRRWGVITMLALATALPAPVYRRGALAPMGRAMFGIRAGASFESLA